MRKLLNKIFSGSLGVGRFFLSGIAFLLGLTLVLLSVQAYFKITSFLSPKTEISDYIILNKEIGLGHTVFGGNPEFSPKDIDDLRQQEFVSDLGIFHSNHFQVKAYVGGQVGFYTELFFESVPDQFLDEKPYAFRWSEGSDFVPLIVSQDFLNLYNFGYALGRGTPQLSKSTIGMVPLKIEIAGPGGRRVFDAKVVGFSERIPSVLVPQNFLQWANVKIGNKKDAGVSRVIIQVKSKNAGNLESYMTEKGLKVSDDKLKFSRVTTRFYIVMSILFLIGFAFVFFSLVIVIMNFALLIAEAKEEIKLLIQLGYKTGYILKHLAGYLFILILIFTGVSVGVYFVGNHFMIEFFNSSGVTSTKETEIPVWYALLVFVGLSILTSMYYVSRILSRHS